MLSHVHDESKRQIDYNRRPERNKRCINEKQSDTGRCYTHFFANSGTHTERVAFEEVLNVICKPVHNNF
jgi:hypothetical protein